MNGLNCYELRKGCVPDPVGMDSAPPLEGNTCGQAAEGKANTATPGPFAKIANDVAPKREFRI